MIARLRQQPAQTKWLWSLSGICRSYRVAAVELGREELSPSVKERIYFPMYLHQYKMLINTGHLLTGDVGNRAQSLAPGWSTVESRLLFQAVIQQPWSSSSEAVWIANFLPAILIFFLSWGKDFGFDKLAVFNKRFLPKHTWSWALLNAVSLCGKAVSGHLQLHML